MNAPSDTSNLSSDHRIPAHRLSVVVPMYNEVELAADLIDAVQAALADYPWPWELVIVDDGSTDKYMGAFRIYTQ